MSNVVALGRITATNEPVQEIVEELEMLLNRAKLGELRAFAYVHVDGGNFSSTGWVAGTVHAGVLVGAVSRMHYKMNKSWDDAASPDNPVA